MTVRQTSFTFTWMEGLWGCFIWACFCRPIVYCFFFGPLMLTLMKNSTSNFKRLVHKLFLPIVGRQNIKDTGEGVRSEEWNCWAVAEQEPQVQYRLSYLDLRFSLCMNS